MARIIELIEVKERRGEGTVEKPFSIVWCYYRKNGELLFEKDYMEGLEGGGKRSKND